MNTLHVVYATDDGYLVPTMVAAASVLAWVKDVSFVQIHVLDTGIADVGWDDFEKNLRGHFGQAFRLTRHKIDQTLFSGFKTWHGSVGTYARLLIPDLIPDADWCVYCDGDTRFYSFFNLIGFFFFCAGISFAVWGEDAKKFIDRNRIPLAWIGLAVLLVLSSSSFPMRLPFSIIWYRVVGGLALFLSMPTCKPLAWLASSCFAIYVFHEFIYTVYGIGNGRLGLSVFRTSHALSILPLLMAAGVCICFVQLVKRYAPKLGEYLLGGRC
ncbi:MAG: hypothetical protein KBT68_03110 [bacterium]|nr:hypothetical protein [Candidatus Colisoma equi]